MNIHYYIHILPFLRPGAGVLRALNSPSSWLWSGFVVSRSAEVVLQGIDLILN